MILGCRLLQGSILRLNLVVSNTSMHVAEPPKYETRDEGGLLAVSEVANRPHP